MPKKNQISAFLEELSEFLPEPLPIGALILGAAFLGVAFFKRSVRRLQAAHYVSDQSSRRLIASARLFIYLVAALLLLQATGIVAEAWTILSAVLATLAVGFVANWSILSNVTSALVILTFRPFRVGDRIDVYDAEKVLLQGRVVDLNLMFTTVILGDYATRVPNNFFLQHPVRVSREGRAPDPAADLSSTFY